MEGIQEVGRVMPSDEGDIYSRFMRRISALVLASMLALALAGCAAPAMDPEAVGVTGTPTSDVSPSPSASSSDVVVSGSTDAKAQAQAHAWLEEVALPSGAVPADASVASFSSFTGWPCGPVAELKAFWSIPDVGVVETANWLRGHPTGTLISTAGAPLAENPEIQSTTVGYIPAEGAQEGIVYTVEKTSGGVAVRAEIAVQTATASCPQNGEHYGAPGQG